MPRKRFRNLRLEPTLKKGPVRRSKRVLDRYKATQRLLGSIESLKEKAAAGFARRFAEELRDGEAVPDQTLALELAGRAVKTAMDALDAADDAYRREAIGRNHLNDACVHVADTEVYPEAIEVRRSITARFGREAARSVHGMEGRTRRKPKALKPQLDYLVGALRDPKHRLPPPLRPGAVVDRGRWLNQIEPGYEKLRAMLRELEELEHLEARLRDERDDELEAFDAVYAEALGLVRAVYGLGGIPKKLIWNLLPTVQQRRLRDKARGEREARADGRRPARRSGSGDDEAE